MKRYQVYLNQNSVSILDEFEKYANISRSKLIREAIDRLAQNLSRIFVAKNIAPGNRLVFDSLIGAINLKGKKETNYALKKDADYLLD